MVETSLAHARRAKWFLLVGGIALIALVLWGLTHKRAGNPAAPPVVRSSAPSQPTTGQASAGPGTQRAEVPCAAALAQAVAARAVQLGQQADAGSQLAYAMTVPFDIEPDLDRMPPEELERIAMKRQRQANRALLRAAELAPERSGILFLAAAQCAGQATCRGVQKALLAAEPDNMAAWLLELNWAKAREDGEAARIALIRAAQATRYDMHVESRLQTLVDAYGASPLPAACANEAGLAFLRRETGSAHVDSLLDHALVLGSGNRASLGYGAIREQCLPTRSAPVDGPARKACRTILERLAKGDTFIDRGFGLASLLQLLADSPEAAPWRESYREYLWMRAQMMDPDTHASLRPEDYALDEVRAYRGVLEAAGRWPPPADWLPDDPDERSRLLTGRPLSRPTR